MAQSLNATLARDHSMAATWSTPWLDCRGSYHVSIQAFNSATGTPVGAWTVQESNDPSIDAAKWSADGDGVAASASKVESAASTRVEIVGTGLTVSSANATLINIERPARYVRLTYTRTSGTGTASVFAQGVM